MKKSGIAVTVIRSWLGHAHLDTTNHYARASLEAKRKALEQVDSTLRPTKPVAGSAMPMYWPGSTPCDQVPLPSAVGPAACNAPAFCTGASSPQL
jgi:hypothetical protein